MNNSTKRRVVASILALAMVFSTAFTTVTPASAATGAVKSVTLKIGGKNVTKKTYKLAKGKTAKIKATVKGAKKKVTFKTSNKKVVTVSKNGKVKAVKNGTAKITVTVKGTKKKTWVKIKVGAAAATTQTPATTTQAPVATTQAKQEDKKPTGDNKQDGNKQDGKSVSVTVAPKTATVSVGQTVQLAAEIKNSQKTATWNSNKPECAAVDANGVVSGLKAGEATITATVDGVTDTCKVTVVSTAPTIKNATQIADGTIKVTFTAPFAQTEGVEFEVKTGETKIPNMTPTWNDTKDEVTLKYNGTDFAEGSYTVVVKANGDSVESEAIAMEAAKKAKIEIPNTFVDFGENVAVPYVIKDQWGNKMTLSRDDVRFEVGNTSKDQTRKVTEVDHDSNNIYLDTSNATAVEDDVTKNDKINITVNVIGTTLSKNFQLTVDTLFCKEFKFDGFKAADGSDTVSEFGSDQKIVVAYTAKDQHGEPFVLSASKGSSEVRTVKFGVLKDDEENICNGIPEIDEAGVMTFVVNANQSGTFTLTANSANAAFEQTTLPVEVKEAAYPAEIVLNAKDNDVLAIAGESIESIPVSFKDQNGKEMRPVDVAEIFKYSPNGINDYFNFATTAKDKNVEAKITVALNATGDKLVVDASSFSNEENMKDVAMTFQNVKKNVKGQILDNVKKQFTVGGVAHPATVKFVKDAEVSDSGEAKLLQNHVEFFDVVVRDQHGRTYKKSLDDSAYSLEAKVDGEAKSISITKDPINMNEDGVYKVGVYANEVDAAGKNVTVSLRQTGKVDPISKIKYLVKTDYDIENVLVDNLAQSEITASKQGSVTINMTARRGDAGTYYPLTNYNESVKVSAEFVDENGKKIPGTTEYRPNNDNGTVDFNSGKANFTINPTVAAKGYIKVTVETGDVNSSNVDNVITNNDGTKVYGVPLTVKANKYDALGLKLEGDTLTVTYEDECGNVIDYNESDVQLTGVKVANKNNKNVATDVFANASQSPDGTYSVPVAFTQGKATITLKRALSEDEEITATYGGKSNTVK